MTPEVERYIQTHDLYRRTKAKAVEETDDAKAAEPTPAAAEPEADSAEDVAAEAAPNPAGADAAETTVEATS